MNAGESGHFAVRLMKLLKRANVNVAHSIAVSKGKNTFRFQITPGTPKSRTGHGFLSGINQCNAPRLGRILVKNEVVGIAGMRGVFQKKFTNTFALVTEE